MEYLNHKKTPKEPLDEFVNMEVDNLMEDTSSEFITFFLGGFVELLLEIKKVAEVTDASPEMNLVMLFATKYAVAICRYLDKRRKVEFVNQFKENDG